MFPTKGLNPLALELNHQVPFLSGMGLRTGGKMFKQNACTPIGDGLLPLEIVLRSAFPWTPRKTFAQIVHVLDKCKRGLTVQVTIQKISLLNFITLNSYDNNNVMPLRGEAILKQELSD